MYACLSVFFFSFFLPVLRLPILLCPFSKCQVLNLTTSGHIQTRKMDMEVNPNRKLGVDPRRWLTVNIFPATPVAKPSTNVMLCIPLDLVGTTERGDAM